MDKKLKKIISTHKKFEQGKITSSQVISVLENMYPMSIEELKEKILSKEMSIVRIIVNYLKDYKSVYDAHNGVAFEKTMAPVYKMYLYYLAAGDSSIKELSFTDFVKGLLKTFNSKSELKVLNNDKLFWEFVKDIEEFIKKSLEK